MLTKQQRKEKGKANREKIANTRKQKEEGTYTVPHISTLAPDTARMPTTQRDMQAHLTGRYPDQFRGPLNRAERRLWDRWWKLKGPGFTKPLRRRQ